MNVRQIDARKSKAIMETTVVHDAAIDIRKRLDKARKRTTAPKRGTMRGWKAP